MKVVCLVQARVGSTRLPGNILKKICGKTILHHEIDRLKKAKSDIKTAIINKGGTISDTATIDTYASAIDGISTGGGVPIVAYGLGDLMV